MKNESIATLLALAFLSQGAFASQFVPLPEKDSVELDFDSRITAEVKASISNDFWHSLSVSANEVELIRYDSDPTNEFRLVGFWHPYSFAATNPLGPNLPEDGILSNGIFTIDVSYDFATNYQHHLESTAAYTNEIAAAYAFIESVSPANLHTMTTNQLLGLDLYKHIPPGQAPADQEVLDAIVSYCRNRIVLAPPRHAFCVWNCGPTNAPPYLWCFPPSVDRWGKVSPELMIYFQGRWWFTEWFLHPGEQQW